MADPTEHLYGLALEEFIPARDTTAREVRRAGDRETAAKIAKLPKPTPPAWTANQLARERPELIAALLEAGAALRAAQEAALAGEGAEALRPATLAERAAVDAVMSAAAGYRPAGRPLSGAMNDRLRTILRAAAGDEALRAALAAGRLVGEAQAGGAWPFALEPPGERPAKSPEPPAPAPEVVEADDEAAARRAAEEREAAARERAALEEELREARGALRALERAAGRAVSESERAQERLAAARAELEDAQADAEVAARLRGEAETALADSRDAVARLEERLD